MAGSAAGRLGLAPVVIDGGTETDAFIRVVARSFACESGGEAALLVNSCAGSGVLTLGVITTSKPISRKRRASLRAVHADC
jgi:hypothetical protein